MKKVIAIALIAGLLLGTLSLIPTQNSYYISPSCTPTMNTSCVYHCASVGHHGKDKKGFPLTYYEDDYASCVGTYYSSNIKQTGDFIIGFIIGAGGVLLVSRFNTQKKRK